MPKRVGFLYDKMVDKGFIKETILKASLPFWPDCIIQWLIVEVAKPVFMRGMCHWSCASIPGRGTKRIRKHLQYVLRHDVKGTKYACEMDIKKYYENIEIPLLMKSLERKIKDKRFLKLIENIVLTCDKGLAVGYYLNQWLANYFLESLDTYIFTLDGVKYMTRHMDNIIILGPNKRKLRRARAAIEIFMNEKLHVEMKNNWQVFPVSKRMISAVGYRFSHNHTILRKRNFLRFRRQAIKVKKKLDKKKPILFKQAAGLLSRTGQLKHCDSHNVRVEYIDPIKVKIIKNVVRKWMKKIF